MMRMFDGEQKISDWPAEAKRYIQNRPNNRIMVGQSTRSQHKLLACRLIGKRAFVGYNKKIKCFVAWNVAPNIGDAHRSDDIYLKLSTHGQKIIEANPVPIALYERVSRKGKSKVYQKICVIPEADFIDFYDNYESYLKPDRKDTYFRAPVAEFTL